MIIFGTRLYGKVDAVPGLGHVATRFFHIDYVPLIPVGSYLVLGQAGKSFRGVPIPLSFKSLLLAWVRAISLVVGVIGAIMLAVAMLGTPSDRISAMVPGVIMAVVGWGIFSFSLTHRSATKASYRRACELGRCIKLNPQAMAALAKVYGEAPVNYGFEPLPVRQPPTPVPPMAIEQPESIENLELIPADGEDGDADTPETGNDVIPLEPTTPPIPAPPRPVQPIRPRGGY